MSMRLISKIPFSRAFFMMLTSKGPVKYSGKRERISTLILRLCFFGSRSFLLLRSFFCSFWRSSLFGSRSRSSFFRLAFFLTAHSSQFHTLCIPSLCQLADHFRSDFLHKFFCAI